MKIVKSRSIYIWEGPDTITITKGHRLQGDYLKSTKIKHRGLFSKWVPIINLEEVYVSAPKNLCVKDKILPMWEVIKIKMDYATHEPYTPDLNPALVSRIKTLQNEVDIWKKRYFEEKRKILDLSMKDRFEERMKKFVKTSGELKQMMHAFGDGMGYGYPGYGYGYGLGRSWLGPVTTPTTTTTNE